MNSFQNNTLTIKEVSKSFDGQKIIDDINISLGNGQIVSLLGKSGVGKTTLFNIIAGVSDPDKGYVYLKDKDITNAPGNISYMLQKDLLIEQKKVIDNIILPLLINKMSRPQAVEKAKQYTEMFGLKGYEDSYPKDLSGGMRQRAAFLRTYMASNNVLLLDEPFSALDAITKNDFYKWYQKVSADLCLSTLFITHNIDEALILSDKIYIMQGKPGKIVKKFVLDKNEEEDFSLSNKFLQVKKEILEIL